MLAFVSSIGQTKTPEAKNAPEVTDETIIFAATPPEFPGGNKELLKFISKNMTLPVSTCDPMCITIFVGFTINTEGNVANAKILRGAKGCPQCDEEALRVIRSMPQWKPAIDKGKPVATFFNLPIRIKT